MKYLKKINELNIKYKDRYTNIGTEHDIYPSKKHNDRLYKVPKDFISKSNMKNWISTFKKYPDIFPKIYKVGNNYVEIEKLDTERVIQELNNLTEVLEYYDYLTIDYNIIDLFKKIVFLETLSIKNGDVTSKSIKKINSILDYYQSKIFTKWMNFFYRVYQVTKKEVGPSDKFFDIHEDNIGYSGNNLKLIDI